MTLVIHAFGATNVGRIREHNEDNFMAGRTVFAVADGMGGHAAGEVASEAALGPLRTIDGTTYADGAEATAALAAAVSEANEVVIGQASADPELSGMGTTLTTVMVRGARMHLAHVGDSRAYLLRRGILEMLTEDHTLVHQLVKDGRLTEEQAAVHPQRSVITRAIGVERGVLVDTMTEPLELSPGDQILLCSDGLTGPVSDSLIAEILSSETDGDTACRRLIDAANAGGGPDNITCVLLRADGDGEAAAPRPVHRAGLTDDDATADLGDPEALDARRLAELGAGSEDTPQQQAEERSQKSRRMGATILGVVLILAVIIGGAVLLLDRSYYVGLDDQRSVGIYRGVQGSVVGISLATLVEPQGFTLDDVPEHLHAALFDGVPFPTLAGARMYVDDTLLPSRLGASESESPPTDAPSATGSEPKDPPSLPAPSPQPEPAPS